MSTTAPRFGVSQFTTMPWTFAEDVARYRAAGIDAIEVCECKLDEERAEQQLAHATANGLEITSLQCRFHSLFPTVDSRDPADPAERMAHFRASIARYAAHTPGAVFVAITGAIPQGDFRAARRVAVREYRALAEFAGDLGVTIALETLNPIHMNTHSFICSLREAMEIVDEVDHPAFGAWVDVWHVWQDASVIESIGRCGGRIFGVHVNDWHAPRRFEDRAVIGTGCMPLPALLSAIHGAGYRGAYTLELFSDPALPDSLWKQDLERVLRDNQRGFARACVEAGMRCA